MRVLVTGLLCTALVLCGRGAWALSVTPTDDAATLTSTILGAGIRLVDTPTYHGAPVAAGTFQGGLAAGIGIDSGMLLTTGKATGAVGPNRAENTTTEHYYPGVPDLAALSILPTFDAAVLEFSFLSDGGDLFFRYVFASEEYDEFVYFPDVFAFFLDGQNLAVLPGTTDAVGINTVNASSPDLFINNALSAASTFPFDIAYDGFTEVLTAAAYDLAPGAHTMRLAIADTGDFALDSAAFIQAGTFSDRLTSPLPPTAHTPEPGTWLLLSTGLLGLGGYGWRQRLGKSTATLP